MQQIIISKKSEKDPKNKKLVKKQKWYGPNLLKMKIEIKQLGKLLCAHPRVQYIRENYFKRVKLYRKQCKIELRKFKFNIMRQMESLHRQHPSQYWKLVEELSDKKKSRTNIEIEELFKHYKNLNSSGQNTQSSEELNDLEHNIEDLEQIKSFSELDYIITNAEVSNAISKLKNKKAHGPDMIKNEMIKYGKTHLLQALTKLFNLVLSTGHYPSIWSIGRIVSIHKKGDPSNPVNYRGITISSTLGKLFNSILNRRLCNFLDDRNILCDEQSGFRKKHRTSDHMFILKNVINKYKRGRKSLYIAFVDFKQAFDTISHNIKY